MRKPSRQFNSLMPKPDSDVVLVDDAGSGLFEACKTRFAPPDYDVECDAVHTVWVSKADGSRSFGLSPWVLRQHSVNEVLERTERKLKCPSIER